MRCFFYEKNLFFLFSVFLISFAYSAPVTGLNLVLVNPPATIGKDLNYQLTWSGGDANFIYWKFDSDGNVLTGSVTSTFENNYSDDSLTNMGITSGGWTESTGVLKGTSSTGEIFQKISDFNSQGKGLDVYFDVNAFNIAVAIYNTNADANGNGYQFTTSAGELKVKRIDAGVATELIAGAHTTALGSRLRYKFDINGLITLYDDGEIVSSAADSNYSIFTHYVVSNSTANAAIDNLVINYLSASPSVIPSGKSLTHNFSVAGQKIIQATVQNKDGNASTSLTQTISGYATFRVRDENKLTKISGATLTIDGINYTTGNDGNVSLLNSAFLAGSHTVILDVNSEFSPRTFVFTSDGVNSFDVNLLALQLIHGSTRNFKIYKPDKITLIQEKLIEWRRAKGVNGGITQRNSTNSAGEISFFGQQDADYNLFIYDGDTNRLYTGTVITIEKPRDITDFSVNFSNYGLNVGGLATQTYSALTTTLSFKIYSDTTDYYILKVDTNSDYYSTQKLVKTLGGATTETYLPLVVPILATKGIETTIYTIDNQNNRTSLPNIRIVATSDVNGNNVVTESKISDGTGVAVFHFEIGRNYVLNFYSGDTLIVSLNLSPSSSNLFAFLDTGMSSTVISTANIQVDWSRPINRVPNGDGNIHISVMLYPVNTTIKDINLFAYSDSNLVYNKLYSINSSQDYNFDFNFSVTGYNQYIPVKIVLNITDSNGVAFPQFSASYTIVSTDFFNQGIESGKQGLGTGIPTILGIFISVAVIGFFTRNSLENNNWFFVVMALLMGILVFLGLVDFTMWVLGAFFGLAVTIWQVRD